MVVSSIFQCIVFINFGKLTKDSLLFPQSKFAKCGLKQGKAQKGPRCRGIPPLKNFEENQAVFLCLFRFLPGFGEH